MRITQVTRRDIADAIMVEKINWAGRLEEQEFLARLFDLSSLPSTDGRFGNAAGDIWQHRSLNPTDWSDDWAEKRGQATFREGWGLIGRVKK
jgi:hypothetical protein